MTSKESGRRMAATAKEIHLHYTLADFKNTSPIIDADALQIARFSRGRPVALTEMIIA